MQNKEPKNMDPRQARGYDLFKTHTIKPSKGGGWLVPSQTSGRQYHVTEEFECNCADSQLRGITCKHAYAARYSLHIEKNTPKGNEVTKIRLTYPQAWSAYNEAQTHEVRLFDELLNDLTEGIEEPEQYMGRPRLPLKDVVFCAIQKVYSQLSSRRASSLFDNALERQQIECKSHFNTVSGLLNQEDITPLLHRLVGITASPLRSVETEFAVDSSGFRTTSFNEYALYRLGIRREHHWLKAHVCVGVKTNVVTGVEITHANAADSPMFKPLVETTANNGFDLKEVSADKAYSSRPNLEAVDSFGGQAFIPFKSNVKGWSGGSFLWRKMYHYFQLNNHKRSNVETTFHMIKAKFGDKLKSKNPVAQENELLCKIIAHNVVVLIHEMMELGITPKF